MLARRVYQDVVRCPHCSGHWMPKAGRNRGRQSYRWGGVRQAQCAGGRLSAGYAGAGGVG